jgi:hypothetical protein
MERVREVLDPMGYVNVVARVRQVNSADSGVTAVAPMSVVVNRSQETDHLRPVPEGAVVRVHHRHPQLRPRPAIVHKVLLANVDGMASNVEAHVHREHPANLIAVVLLPIASAQLHRNPADSMDRNVEERAREMQHAGKLMRDVSVW